LFFGVEANLDAIDQTLVQYTGRAIASVDPVERAILRLACYEFLKRLDVPYRVVLNEAVTLTKKFCAAQSHTFVNAVLDKVAHEVRATEVSQA
jgi:N utilization substance protein B